MKNKEIQYLRFYLNKIKKPAMRTLVFSKNEKLSWSIINRIEGLEHSLRVSKIFRTIEDYMKVRSLIIQKLWDVRFYKRLGII